MIGQAAFNKPARPAALCRGVTIENRKAGWSEETELIGVEEERDGMSDEEGNGIDGEEELAAPDWRVRAGPRNKPTQRERREREATHVPFRDWCVHCMMGRGRTYHHVAKQRSEDQSRRPLIAMDYFFNGISVAVKEDRHPNIMSGVAMKKGFEDPWTIERVVRFNDLLGYREITLKSDIEPAIVAFRSRVAAMCKAEVTTEDAVKGDKKIKWAHRECDNAAARNRSNSLVPRLVEHAGCIVSRAQKGRDRRTPFERFHGKKPTQESSRSERRCWQGKSPQIR